MLTPADLIRLPYSPDLTRQGIEYALPSLAYTYDRMGGSSFQRLRRIVAGVAVERALHRYLREQEVPFNTLGATPFTEPDHYDLALGKHHCDLKSFHLSHRKQIRQVRRQPGLLLDAPALVPLDQHVAEGHRDNDLYLFAFLLGLIAASPRDIAKAQAAGQPVFLIHPLPDGWARPVGWAPLTPLALKSECAEPLTVEIGGQDAEGHFVTQTLELLPRKRLVLSMELYTVFYLHVNRLPEARIGIHSIVRSETYLIPPSAWGNIWVYGMDIFLVGWMTRQEFRHKAEMLPAGISTFQYKRTRTKNLAVPMQDLHPFAELFERIRHEKEQARGLGTT